MFEYELKKLNLSEKREQQLKLPYIAKDVETIRIMTEIYCHAHHNTKEGLCPECEEFYLYSVKRLACCPFGEKKPVCAKCKIHCYGKGYKERAKEIMAFSGPKLLLKHPILSMRHIMAPRTSGKTYRSQTASIGKRKQLSCRSFSTAAL